LAEKKFLYEGKAKKVYAIDDNQDEVLVEFKDDATAFDGTKKGTITQKGIINNSLSCYLFDYLKNKGIDNHFVKKVSDREMRVKKLEIILVEVVMRNYAAGSLCKRYGIKEGLKMPEPIVEYYYKDDALHDPLMNEYHIFAMDLATREELEMIKNEAIKINSYLVEFFKDCGIKLVDFKLEFGRFKDKILLGDEISPDTCRFWDMKTDEKMDKDRFRFDLGNVEGAYKDILKRVVGENL